MKPESTSKISLPIPTLLHYLGGIVIAFSAVGVLAQTTPVVPVPVPAPVPITVQADNPDEEPLTREQILALFEREAEAAYAIAKKACAPLIGQGQQRCLAQARLQYDADRRYARKRADQGY